MNVINRILGEAIRPPTKSEKSDSCLAYQYAAHVLKGRFPDGEKAIATYPTWAHWYAKDVLKGRFPEGEATIAKDPYRACRYAMDIIHDRWPEAEAVIAADPEWSAEYLKAFPEAKLDWAMNGLTDWTDL